MIGLDSLPNIYQMASSYWLQCGFCLQYITMSRNSLTYLFAVLLASCGEQVHKTTCTPNFVGQGVSVQMSFLRDNSDGSSTYSIELCTDTQPPGIRFSVYGATTNQFQTSDADDNVRLNGIENSSYAGDHFEVNFKSLDYWFGIYLDKLTAGHYVLDTTSELIKGQLSQSSN